MKGFRRILYATDFSSASRAAFVRALELARVNRAELLIAHVIASVGPLGIDGYVTPRMYQDMEATIRRFAEKHLAPLLARARKTKVRYKGLLLKGSPHAEIARAARQEKADLVVVGTHGRTGMARVFLGSVAARVITSSPCPVLAVRGR